ncbi:MAG: hypothetical protein ACLPWS_22265 [Rhodomicrobium sp.]
MRLLIAEDNVRLGTYIRAALSERGFTADLVETAGDAEAALSGVDYEGAAGEEDEKPRGERAGNTPLFIKLYIFLLCQGEDG